MELHLNENQIDQLLRPAGDSETLSPFEREALEDAHAHLNVCDSCRREVLQQKKAVERLALLKSSTHVSRGQECPPDDVWIEVAAGIASPASDRYLNHAVECDHCGQLLNQAAKDFIEDLTPQEEIQIANLSSSTAGWQTTLAAKLRDSQPATSNLPSANKRWFSSFVSSIASSRLAFAAALAVVVALGVWDYSLTAHLSSRSLQAAADSHRLEQDVLQQKAQIADLTARLSRPVPSTAPGAPQPVEEASVASLSLDAGLTRGVGEMKRLAVPAGTTIVRITLHMIASPDGVVREDLLDFDRHKIWSQELRPSDAEKRSNSLTLLVPAYLLKPDDYLIKVSHALPDNPVEVATFSFRIPR